jgi:hypothetical protein
LLVPDANVLTLFGANASAAMARIFDPIASEVDKLVSDQIIRVKFEKIKAGKTEEIKVSLNIHQHEDMNYFDGVLRISSTHPGRLSRGWLWCKRVPQDRH